MLNQQTHTKAKIIEFLFNFKIFDSAYKIPEFKMHD